MPGGQISGGGGSAASTKSVDGQSAVDSFLVSGTTDTRSNNFKSYVFANNLVRTATYYLYVGPNYTKTSLKLIVGIDTGVGGGGSGTLDLFVDVTYASEDGKNLASFDESLTPAFSDPIEGYQELEVTLDETLAEANCLVFVSLKRDGVNDAYADFIRIAKVVLFSE